MEVLLEEISQGRVSAGIDVLERAAQLPPHRLAAQRRAALAHAFGGLAQVVSLPARQRVETAGLEARRLGGEGLAEVRGGRRGRGFRRVARDRGLEFSIDIAADLPAPLHSDSTKLARSEAHPSEHQSQMAISYDL